MPWLVDGVLKYVFSRRILSCRAPRSRRGESVFRLLNDNAAGRALRRGLSRGFFFRLLDPLWQGTMQVRPRARVADLRPPGRSRR